MPRCRLMTPTFICADAADCVSSPAAHTTSAENRDERNMREPTPFPFILTVYPVISASPPKRAPRYRWASPHRAWWLAWVRYRSATRCDCSGLRVPALPETQEERAYRNRRERRD